MIKRNFIESSLHTLIYRWNIVVYSSRLKHIVELIKSVYGTAVMTLGVEDFPAIILSKATQAKNL